jgi:FkbM family methyltransferase
MSTMQAEFEQELEALLAEGIEGARRREATEFDRLTGSNAKELVLFGAGNLGRYTLAGLRNAGIEPLSFIDNNEAKWGESQHGLRVLSPEDGARSYGDRATFVVAIWYGEASDTMASRVAQLRHLGCRSVVPFPPLYWKLSDSLLPRYMVDLPHKVHLQANRVRQGLKLMADDLSRQEYLAQLRFRLLSDFECLPGPVEGAIYFCDDLFGLGQQETLVDCGAYDGDTLDLFLRKTSGSFKSVIAFEPDPANYAKLEERLNLMPLKVRERVALHKAGTGETNERLRMDVGSGVASQIGRGDHEVECVSLDSTLPGVPVSFIKMDIEGSELATLAGAQSLIRKNKPILAISAYHRQDDLWNIPLFIHALDPDYSFYLRPHLLEGWDLVCYAVPSNRRY